MWWLREVCMEQSDLFLTCRFISWTRLVELRIRNLRFRPLERGSPAEPQPQDVLLKMPARLSQCQATLKSLAIEDISYDEVIWNTFPRYRVVCFAHRVEVPVTLMYWSFPEVRCLSLMIVCYETFLRYMPNFFSNSYGPSFLEVRFPRLSRKDTIRKLGLSTGSVSSLPVERVYVRFEHVWRIGEGMAWRLVDDDGSTPLSSRDQAICRLMGPLNAHFPQLKSLELGLEGPRVPHGSTVNLTGVKRLSV